jgi:hypothetical protein
MGLWRDYSIEDEALMARNEDELAREAQERKNSEKLALALGLHKTVKSDSNLSIHRGSVVFTAAAASNPQNVTSSSSGSTHEIPAVVQQNEDLEKAVNSGGNQIDDKQIPMLSTDENRELLVDDYADEDEEVEEAEENLLDFEQEAVFEENYGFKDRALLKMEQLKR